MDDAALKAAAAAFDRLPGDAKGVLVAVSGGPDSMALLALLAAWVQGSAVSFPVQAATVDHGLRPESTSEAARVAAFARTLHIPHATLVWTGPKPATGLQEAARDARYRLLADHARHQRLDHIALAHHADDQAETVWMRLAAGSGIAGLSGMRERSVRGGIVLWRPLLAIPKAVLVQHCAANGIPFVTDASNGDGRFARARTRRLLPQLAETGLSTGRLLRLAARAARADAALNTVASSALAAAALPGTGQEIRLNWHLVAPHPEEIRLRVLLAALAGRNDPVEPQKLENAERLLGELDRALADQARLRRSQGPRVVTLRVDGVLVVGEAPPRRRPG